MMMSFLCAIMHIFYFNTNFHMFYVGANMLDVVPQCNPTIKTRFSTLRFRKVVKQFNPIQIGHIKNHNMSHMLNVPDHLMIPMNLLQWLVGHTSYGGSGSYFFKHKDKQIFFTKDIVDKVFGFEHGTVPFVLDSKDADAVREVEFLRSQYLDGSTIPVSKVESIMLGSNDERVFLRSFTLFYITAVLCPSTYNFINPKYLYSLRDRDILLVEYLDFGSLCLDNLFEEMDSWKDKIFNNTLDYNRITWIGGCLPLLGVRVNCYKPVIYFVSCSFFWTILMLHVFIQCRLFTWISLILMAILVLLIIVCQGCLISRMMISSILSA